MIYINILFTALFFQILNVSLIDLHYYMRLLEIIRAYLKFIQSLKLNFDNHSINRFLQLDSHRYVVGRIFSDLHCASLFSLPSARGLPSRHSYSGTAMTSVGCGESSFALPLHSPRRAFAFASAENANMLPAQRKFAICKPLGLSSIRNDTSSALGLVCIPPACPIPSLNTPFFSVLLTNRPSNSGGDLLGKFPRRR